MFRFEGAVLFASFSYFRQCLIAKSGLDPFRLSKQKKKLALKSSATSEAFQTDQSSNSNTDSMTTCTISSDASLAGNDFSIEANVAQFNLLYSFLQYYSVYTMDFVFSNNRTCIQITKIHKSRWATRQ